jgi:methionyl aminopeptidase
MTIGSHADLAGITAVGQLVGQALREMATAVEPGITTAELDRVGARFLRRRGARSAPQLTYGFPGFTCISVNEEIVHGVPGPRVLALGDVVKLDVTAELGGYVADAAVTVSLPPVAPWVRRLRRSVEAAFARAMDVAQAGQPVAESGARSSARSRAAGSASCGSCGATVWVGRFTRRPRCRTTTTQP